MGFRFKKSINLGGFRINFSKKGIGYSYGVKGLRYTKTADGRKRLTTSIPGTGISYSKSFSKTKKTSNKNSRTYSVDKYNETLYDKKDIIIQTTQNEVVNKLNRSYKKTQILEKIRSLLLIAIIISSLFLFNNLYSLIPLCIFLITLILIPRKCSVDLDYNFSEEDDKARDFLALTTETTNLFSCNKLSEIIEVKSLGKTKGIGASTESLNLSNKIKIYDKIKFINCNCKVNLIKLHNKEILILPDSLFVFIEKQWVSVDYKDIEIVYRNRQFVESESVPSDTKVSNYCWEHMNKNGEPDRRFSNNRRLPVCEYGIVGIRSKNGLRVLLLGSNRNKVKNFYNALKTYISK